MKRVYLIGVFIAILMLFAFVFRRKSDQQTLAIEQTGMKAQRENNPIVLSNAHKLVTSNFIISNVQRPSALSGTDKAFERESQAVSEKNVPLDFYGRVIDQNSNSLSGVKINLRVRHWDIKTFGASIPLQRETDKTGSFDIHNVTGDAFDVEGVEKDGYELEPMQRGFGAVGGTVDTPVVFKMWKNGTHEDLITGQKSFHITPDGRFYYINFVDGTINESGVGDLRIWLKYNINAPVGENFDWSAEFDMINGGLLEEKSLFEAMYVAPTAGYVPSFQKQQQLKGGQQGSIGSKRFYITLNSGQKYGRIAIEILGPFNNQIPGLVRISYAINPSGSKILR